MIIQFSVQNFGSIKDKQTLSFEADKSTHLEDYYIINTNGLRLLKLGLIYGANASGKTTVLKALDFFREIVVNPEDKKTDELDFEPFLFDPHTPGENTILSIEFLQNSIRYYYEVELNKKSIVREELYFYNPNKANVFKRSTKLEAQFTEIKFGGKIKVDKISEKTLEANTLWNNTVLGGFLKTNIDIEELKEVIEWFSQYLGKIIQPNTRLTQFVTNEMRVSNLKKNNILQILLKADFHISDLHVKKDEEIDKKIEFPDSMKDDDEAMRRFEQLKEILAYDIEFEHTVNGYKENLPLEKESQGTQRYYGFAGILLLLIKQAQLFFIDELETSLHPDLFRHFLLTFLVNAKQSQLIATTHNREILNDKDIFRNDAIWITDKSKNCATELYSLADFDSSVIRDTSNVYNAYKIGKLGGVPNLGDYYIDLDE